MNIGVDIGGMSFKYGVVDDKGNILFKNVIKVDKSLSQEEIIINLAQGINSSLADWNIDKSDIAGIGIGCPGAINSTLGICEKAYNLGFENLNICALIKKHTNLDCRITNDANAACLAEARFGAAKKYNNIVMLTLGTGVGGGVIIDKKLYEGNLGKGTELGHMVIKVDGRSCSCGRRGCLEAYASASALIKKTKEELNKDHSSSMWIDIDSNLDNVNGLTAFENEKKGDKAAKKVIDYYVKYLGEGLLNLMNIFRPEVIVLGGGLSNQKEYLNNKLMNYCRKRFFGFENCPEVGIVTATLGNDAGIIGASCLF